MKIAIGADHAGYGLKQVLVDYLKKDHEIVDVGTNSTDSVDYPSFGHKVGNQVASGNCERGIVICGSGIGISISCNKISGIRCALCSEPLSAKLAREHNDANVVALGARLIGEDMAKEILRIFLSTDFLGGRHTRRCNLIEEVEE